MAELDNLEKKHGGARSGAGSKLGAKYKKTVAKEAATLYVIRRVEAEIDPIMTALIDKAIAGDVGAIKETLERGLGKVKEKREYEIRSQPPLKKANEITGDNGVY